MDSSFQKSIQTIKNQLSCVTKIQTALDGDDELLFLLKYEEVSNWLETHISKKTKKPISHASLKTYYASIKSVIKNLQDDRFKEALEYYTKKFIEYTTLVNNSTQEQTLTEAEKKKWLCWECIVSVRNMLLQNYKENPDVKRFQEYLILCLYTYLPPTRLDYSPMKFVNIMPSSKDYNYCVLTSTGATFIINHYKTARTYGQLVYQAQEELYYILLQWKNMNSSEWLLTQSVDQSLPLTSHELGKIITKIFTREMNIPATLNIIRHAYATHIHKGEPSLSTKKATAKIMGHSLGMAELYRRINAE
jgi:hypothetical protein